MTSEVSSNTTAPQESRSDHTDFDPLELEKRFVHEVYDAIAPEFSSTRHSAWPGVMRFLSDQPSDALGADIGCGNGKYLLALSQSRSIEKKSHSADAQDLTTALASRFVPMVALERSVKLAEIVRQRGFDVALGDIMQLPYRSESFDYFICIAVLHHLSTQSRRIKAVQELASLLRPGGQGLIQVWAKEQRDPNRCEAATYIRRKTKVNSTSHQMDNQKPECLVQPVPGISLPVHVSGTEFPASDMLVPWKSKKSGKTPVREAQEQSTQDGSIRDRYYHLFVQGELDQLINEVPCLQIQQSYYEQGNWVVQVLKLEQ